jgi:DNA-binding NarL/FixJ family response regulator
MIIESMRVLIVEDNLAQAETIQEMLESIDVATFDVSRTDRLRNATEVLALGETDIVLLDLNLPDSTGLDGVRLLLADFPSLAIIVLTNVEDEAVAREAARLGTHDYLLKRELTPSVLLRAVRDAGERQRNARIAGGDVP